MQRRRFIQFFAAVTTSLWAKQQFPASALLAAAARANGAGGASIGIARESQDSPLPEPLLPLFPLPVVLFPRTNLPLHIFEERYKEMIQDCLQNQWEFGVLLIQENSHAIIGSTASISEVVHRYPDGRMDILVRGRRRFEILELNQEKSYLRGKPQFFDDDETVPPREPSPESSEDKLRPRALELHDRLMDLLASEDPSSKESLKESKPALSGPQLSFQIMADVPAEPGWRQSLLELRSERERLVRVVRYLQLLIDSFQLTPGQRASVPTA